jgi:hypothetical protein
MASFARQGLEPFPLNSYPAPSLYTGDAWCSHHCGLSTVSDIDMDVQVGTRLLRFISQLILSVLGWFVLQPTGPGLDGSCVYHVLHRPPQEDFRNLQEKIVGETRVTGTNRWHFEARVETRLNLSAAWVYIDLVGSSYEGN